MRSLDPTRVIRMKKTIVFFFYKFFRVQTENAAESVEYERSFLRIVHAFLADSIRVDVHRDRMEVVQKTRRHHHRRETADSVSRNRKRERKREGSDRRT